MREKDKRKRKREREIRRERARKVKCLLQRQAGRRTEEKWNIGDISSGKCTLGKGVLYCMIKTQLQTTLEL